MCCVHYTILSISCVKFVFILWSVLVVCFPEWWSSGYRLTVALSSCQRGIILQYLEALSGQHCANDIGHTYRYSGCRWLGCHTRNCCDMCYGVITAPYCVVCADAALVNIIVNGAGTQLRGGDVSRMRSPHFKGWLTKERAVVGISWWPGAIAQDLQHDLLTGSLLY